MIIARHEVYLTDETGSTRTVAHNPGLARRPRRRAVINGRGSAGEEFQRSEVGMRRGVSRWQITDEYEYEYEYEYPPPSQLLNLTSVFRWRRPSEPSGDCLYPSACILLDSVSHSYPASALKLSGGRGRVPSQDTVGSWHSARTRIASLCEYVLYLRRSTDPLPIVLAPVSPSPGPDRHSTETTHQVHHLPRHGVGIVAREED